MNLPLRTFFALVCVAGEYSAALSASQIAPQSHDKSTAAITDQHRSPEAGTPDSKSSQSKADEATANAAGASASADTPAKSGAAQHPAKPYIIGALDVLDIRIWNDTKLTGLYDVRPDGMISMPLVGEIKADGLSVGDLTKVVTARVAAFVNIPEVNIQVVRYNSKKIYIYGGVNHPGEVPLTGEMTVMDVLSNCGGFRDFANPKRIYILRGTQKLKFNYKEVSQGKNLDQNITLQNGDRIFVPE
ncbi:MAG TPA: polysaccharide biosynthesis/export family protein [Bryobacteraceae bacterium]|nr:polysaccharide biosynthesis/export family protein [Bryobacteraceae bacterium]